MLKLHVWQHPFHLMIHVENMKIINSIAAAQNQLVQELTWWERMKKFSSHMTSSSCQSLYWQWSCIPGENTHLCERLLAPVLKWSLPPLTTGLMWVSPSFLPGINFCLWPSHFSQSHSFYYTTRTAVWTSSTRERCHCHNMWSSSWTREHWLIVMCTYTDVEDWTYCAVCPILFAPSLQGRRCLQAILQLYVRNCIKRKWTMKKYPIKCGVNKMSWYKSRL